MRVNIKNVFNVVLWFAIMGVILGAHFTQIPILVTIATAIYWIISIIAPIGLLFVMVRLVVGVGNGKEDILISLSGKSNLSFILSRLRGLISLGVYATVGWIWPFAMVFILWAVVINARLNNK